MAEARKYPGQEKAVFDYYLKNKQAVEGLKAPVFEEKIIDHIISVAKIKETKVSVEDLAAVKGMTLPCAQSVYDYFHKEA